MEITARLTADAEVATVKGDKKVVRFTMAVNDSYRMGEERREITNYFECSYFRNEGIAEYLKKGSIVQVFGRVGVRAYIAKDGEAKGVLTCHVSEIKLFGGSPKNGSAESAEQERKAVPMEQAVKTDDAIKPSGSFDNVPSVGEDDLPF